MQPHQSLRRAALLPSGKVCGRWQRDRYLARLRYTSQYHSVQAYFVKLGGKSIIMIGPSQFLCIGPSARKPLSWMQGGSQWAWWERWHLAWTSTLKTRITARTQKQQRRSFPQPRLSSPRTVRVNLHAAACLMSCACKFAMRLAHVLTALMVCSIWRKPVLSHSFAIPLHGANPETCGEIFPRQGNAQGPSLPYDYNVLSDHFIFKLIVHWMPVWCNFFCGI